MISVNVMNTPLIASDLESEDLKNKVVEVNKMIRERTGLGNDFLGWVNWPATYDREEYIKMQASATSLQDKIEVLVIIGIGGSYLGARAAADMIKGLYPINQKVEAIYVGNTMSSTYVAQVQAYLKNKRFGICVISKSGTTVEPGLAFRLFEKQLWEQEGERAKELIVAVTDKERGALKVLADQKGYQTFTIPDDIGGRFSVLTPVGIYPLMVLGVNTDEIFFGAQKAMYELTEANLDNPAYKYAVARYLLNSKLNYKVETLVSYDLQMQYFNEWWKQLFGESEGKEGQGLLPTSMIFSTDLHSLGQWVQEGQKGLLFETILNFSRPTLDVKITKDPDNFDQLNYLDGKTLDEVNKVALEGVLQAHSQCGEIPNIVLDIDGDMSAQNFGYLVYFFELAVAMSGYLLAVNPFNQPGVEVYKKNMFKLLGKPGLES
ncbi:glucose-6-phosphate isomerase [Entomoplasma freundtii]|uniref:Glucose-6-phosphate isomerase n=1 Tax=Entomoplasma freundtii TaxID=74700 RepID=A0A2K8NTM3_9MOLU|nr:glucose-6-phosphate isomerase [Entomoplasma freundtii]ATZ16528.1 glucose-6-phosphate isomerase [Entomoplasma freundtii]TDY58306.1 glucose-6-phosphate isomerase [Entomoplasma freundtii]